MNIELVKTMLQADVYLTWDGEVMMTDGQCAGKLSKANLNKLINSKFVKMTEYDAGWGAEVVYIKA